MRTFRAAALQIDVGPDREANLSRADELVGEAVAGGAELVVLPERFSHYDRPQRRVAEPDDGPTSAWLADRAARHRIHLAGGYLRTAGGDRDANVLALHGPDGALLARYQKIHLFKVDHAEVTIDENAYLERGTEPMVVETALGRIGLTICYDLRFPELYRTLRGAGAEIVLVPSAFTVPTGRAHWKVLLRARAIENQVFVVAPDQTGTHQDLTPPSYGHSLVLDPWGDALGELGAAEGVAAGELSAERLAEVRATVPCWDHATLL